MAWTLAMGHAMTRAGLRLHTEGWRPDVVHARLAGRAPGDRAGRIVRCAFGFHRACHRGRPAFRLGVRPDQSAGARAGVLAGARVRLADRLLGVDGRGDHRTLRAVRGGNDRDSQRNRLQPLAVRAASVTAGRPSCCSSAGWVRKGVHDAIAALPRIRRAHPGTTLTIAGDGTQRARLVEVARNHRVLKAVRFLGEVDHDELLRLLHRADAAVLPSHYEPFGIVALEAAAAGIPWSPPTWAASARR